MHKGKKDVTIQLSSFRSWIGRTNPPGADLVTSSMGFAHMGRLTLFKIVPYDVVNSFAGPKGEGKDAVLIQRQGG